MVALSSLRAFFVAAALVLTSAAGLKAQVDEVLRHHAREQSARIADLEMLSGGSPMPYAPRRNLAQPIWTKTIHRAQASYLRIHLRMDLGALDELVVRDHASQTVWRYRGKGPVSEALLGSAAATIPGLGHSFATDTIFSDRVHLELYAQSGGLGVVLELLERGYPWSRIQLPAPPENPCVRTPPFPDTACEPIATRRTRARAVCGIANAGVFCSGFLISSRSHFLTANHCLPSAAIAATANLWFGYETDCNSATLRGTTVIPGPHTFLGGEAARDWSLLRAPSNPAAQFGWLSLEATDPIAQEGLYIPGHPGGRPQELTTGPARGVLGFPGNTHFQHRCDTEAGSSGAPVIRDASHCVVGLHTHGACIAQDPNSANWATRMSVLAPILLLIEPTLAVCGTGGSPPVACEPAEILPNRLATEGSASIVLPFHSAGAQRVQFAYGSATLGAAHTLRIRKLRWRLDGAGAASYGPATWDFALDLSTSRKRPLALDRAFELNHGADRTTVFDGVMSATAIGGSASPNAFELALELDRIFEWDPRSGPLLLDFRVRAGTAIGRELDAEPAAVGFLGCIAASGNANATLASFPATGVLALAPVLELCVEMHHGPKSFERSEAPLSATLPWSGIGLNGARVLTAYEAANFQMLGRRRITRIAWRPDAGAALPSASIDVRVALSTAPHGRASTLVPSFAANHGLDRQIVFDGIVTTSPRAAAPTGPAAASMQIELTTPYLYDPADGALIIDLQVRSQTGFNNALWDAAPAVSGSLGRVVHSSDWSASLALSTDATGCEIAIASEPVLDLPLSIARAEGAGVSFEGLASASAARELTVYDGAALSSLEPVFIQGLSWRPEGQSSTDFGPLAWDLALELSTSPHSLQNVPSLFDQVHGPDRQTVFDGIASTPYHDPSNTNPQPATVAIQLQTPFRWDPAIGPLVVDLRVRGRSGNAARGLDATGLGAVGVIRLVHPTDPNAIAAAVGPEANGSALQLWSSAARGRAVPYGTACGTANICTTSGSPQLPSATFAFRLLRGAPQQLAALMLGTSAVLLRLDFIGATGCTWLQSSDLLQQTIVLDAQGHATMPAPLPSDPSLEGAHLFVQWACVDPTANAAGFALSAGLELVLGR